LNYERASHALSERGRAQAKIPLRPMIHLHLTGERIYDIIPTGRYF